MGLEERIKATEEKYKELMNRNQYEEAMLFLQELIEYNPGKREYIEDLKKIKEIISPEPTDEKLNEEEEKLMRYMSKQVKYNRDGLQRHFLPIDIKGEADKWFHKAMVLAAEGNLEQAIEYMDKVIEIDPSIYAAENNKAILLMDLCRPEEALKCYENIVRADPKNVDAFRHKGAVLKILGRKEEALNCYKTATQINPSDHVAWIEIGTVLTELGDPEEAIRCYEKSLSINRDDERAWANMGTALSDLNRESEALTCYEKSTMLRPDSLLSWHNRGVSLRILKKFYEAIPCFEKAIEISQEFAPAWEHKAGCLLELGKYKESFECGIAASDIDKRPDSLFNIVLEISKKINSNPKILGFIKQSVVDLQQERYTGVVVSAFFQYAGDTLKAANLNSRILEVLRLDPSLMSEGTGSFENEGHSRNVVKSTNLELTNNISQVNYVIKICVPTGGLPLNRIEEEYITSLWLWTNLEHYEKSRDEPEPITEVAQPIVFVKDDKNVIYAEKKLNGENLQVILKAASKEEKKAYASQVIATMAKITTIATRELKRTDKSLEICIADSQNNSYNCMLPEIDSVEDIKKRFIERLPAKKTTFRNPTRKFLQEYKRFMSGSEIKAFQNGDSYPWNWIISAHGATSIDYETKAYANIFTDLACLLESEEFNEINKEEQIHFYLRELAKYDPKLADKALSNWKKEYQKAAIHRTLTKAGAAYNAGDIHTAQYNLQRTTELLETQPTLQKAYKKYIKATEIKELVEAK